MALTNESQELDIGNSVWREIICIHIYTVYTLTITKMALVPNFETSDKFNLARHGNY